MKNKIKESGSVLLEGLIAISIFSIGLLGLAAFQLNTMKKSQQARYRAMASYYAEEIISYVSTDIDNAAKFVVTDGICADETFKKCTLWVSKIKAELPGASSNKPSTAYISGTNGNDTKGDFTVTIKWKNPEESEIHQLVSKTNIEVNKKTY